MLDIDICQTLGNITLAVNTRLPASGISAIFGLSGAGKTSLINAIAGLTSAAQGRIVLNDRVLLDSAKGIHLAPEKRGIGYVFQDTRLFPHYRVRGNLQYGMAAEMQTQFDDIVQLLGIDALLSHFPHSLSGGEKQRVAIGRALLSAPDILLMDEPLASLDLPRKHELMPYLERLVQDVNLPILYVSHSLMEIKRLAHYILLLDKGKVCASGPLSQVLHSGVLQPWLQYEEYHVR